MLNHEITNWFRPLRMYFRKKLRKASRGFTIGAEFYYTLHGSYKDNWKVKAGRLELRVWQTRSIPMYRKEYGACRRTSAVYML